MNNIELKLEIIKAGKKAVQELIKVANEGILKKELDGLAPDIAADRLKNAAASKKLAIFDAFEILTKIEEENSMIDKNNIDTKASLFKGFAEGRSK
jgi:hypothetical protein